MYNRSQNEFEKFYFLCENFKNELKPEVRVHCTILSLIKNDNKILRNFIVTYGGRWMDR